MTNPFRPDPNRAAYDHSPTMQNTEAPAHDEPSVADGAHRGDTSPYADIPEDFYSGYGQADGSVRDIAATLEARRGERAARAGASTHSPYDDDMFRDETYAALQALHGDDEPRSGRGRRIAAPLVAVLALVALGIGGGVMLWPSAPSGDGETADLATLDTREDASQERIAAMPDDDAAQPPATSQAGAGMAPAPDRSADEARTITFDASGEEAAGEEPAATGPAGRSAAAPAPAASDDQEASFGADQAMGFAAGPPQRDLPSPFEEGEAATAGERMASLDAGEADGEATASGGLQAQADEPAAGERRTAQATAHVNMRADPDNDATIVRVIPENASIEVVSCERWCEVEYGGERGYVFGRFVSGTQMETAAGQ